jgi:CRISPR-associated endonuclease Csy4
MLRYYQQIDIYDDGEISPGFVWNRLFGLLHPRLVGLKDGEGLTPVGLSFPGYGKERFPLGTSLRLFAPDREMLENMKLKVLLEDYGDYLRVDSVREVLKTDKYVRFYRQQFKNTNPERLARRYAKRHNISFEEALKHYQKLDSEAVVKANKLPYIHLQSASTGQRHRLFIAKEMVDEEVEGRFNTYGLGKTATIPCF